MRRSVAFSRLTPAATLWYFIAILVFASLALDPILELALLSVLIIAELVAGNRTQLWGYIRTGASIGIAIALFTLILHRHGERTLFHWRWLTITDEGVLWAVSLGLGMIILSVMSLTMSRGVQRSEVFGSLSTFAARTALICQMATAILPNIIDQVRTLSSLQSSSAPSSRGNLIKQILTHPAAFAIRLQSFAYAVLSSMMETASTRMVALTLAIPSGAAPRSSTRSHIKTVRSLCFAVLIGLLLLALTLRPTQFMGQSLYLTNHTYLLTFGYAAMLVGVIIMAALPYLFEGGGRLWARLHA